MNEYHRFDEASDLESLAKYIISFGYNESDACDLAAYVGDTPRFEGEYLLLYMKEKLVGRVPIPPMFKS